MALTYSLKILSLSKQQSFRLDTEEVLDNVVTSVKFYLEGSETVDDKLWSGVHYGTCPLLVPTVEGFVQYEDLTEDLIKSAIEKLYPMDQAELDIIKQIEDKKNPITNESVLPWGEE